MRLVKSSPAAALVLLAAACGGGGRGGAQAVGLAFTGLPYRVGVGPVDVRLADMDCDGLLDIVALCPGDSSITVRRHVLGDLQSNPLYEEARHTLLPDSPRDFCVADVDGDGLPDLVAITGDPDFDLVVLHNEGASASVQFNPKEYSLTKGNASRVAAGDVNGDGKADLVLLDEAGGAVTLLLNDPAAPGAFLVPAVQLPSFGGACSELAVGDVDGDGLVDVMTLTAGDGAFSFLRQAPGGAFTHKHWLPAAFRVAQHFALGDMDGDGRLDVVVSRSIPENSVDYMTLFQDPASASGFRESPTLRSTGQTQSMRLADVNRDGRLDLVAAEADAAGATTATVYVGDPSSPSAMKKGTVKFFNEAKGFGRALAVADVNGDGFLDFVLADSTRDTVDVLLRNGAPPVPPAFVGPVQLDSAPGTHWVDVRLGDLNGDGKADVVAGGPDGITFFFQDPAAPATFLPAKAFPVVGGVDALAIGDVDGDGRPDVAFSNSSGGQMGVLWHSAAAPEAFDAPTVFGLGTLCDGVVLADLDGDGHLDLATTAVVNGAGTVQVKMHLAGSPRGFASGPPLAFQAGPDPLSGLFAGDFDCDGRVDIACASESGDTLVVLLHAPGSPPPGPGLFLAPQVVLFAGGVRVAAGDVNGDGAADLVTADTAGVTVALQDTSDGSTAQWPSAFRMASVTVTGSPGGSAQLALADVDRDGRPDIVAGGSDGGGFRLLRNDPSATDGFSMHVYQHNKTDLEFLSVAVGDVNGDGWADVVTATGPAPGAAGGHIFLWTQIPGPH